MYRTRIAAQLAAQATYGPDWRLKVEIVTVPGGFIILAR